MASYREKFFNNTPSVNGRYQCVRCLGWFTKEEIDVDHRVAKRNGGTDDLFNLQAMCKHCNRSKGDSMTGTDIVQTAVNAAASEGLDGLAKVGKGMLSRKIKSAIGLQYRR